MTVSLATQLATLGIDDTRGSWYANSERNIMEGGMKTKRPGSVISPQGWGT